MKRPGSFLRSRRGEVLTAGFGIFTVLLLVLLGKLFLPFIRPVAWASVIAVTVAPAFPWLLGRLGGRRWLAALAVVLAAAGAAVGPAAVLGLTITHEAGRAADAIRASLERGTVNELVARLAAAPRHMLPGALSEGQIAELEGWLRRFAAETTTAASRRIGRAFNLAVGGLARAALDFGIALLVLFFLLRDGPSWLRWLREATPLATGTRDLIINRARETIRAVVYGMVLTAAVQGALLGIGFWMFGVPLPVFFSLLGFIFALIPLVGPTSIWAPAALWLYWTGHPGAAIGLAVWCALLVSTLDNFLRPWLIGERAKLPVLLLFLGILGGFLSFGALGLFLGPVLIAIAAAVGEVYRDASSDSMSSGYRDASMARASIRATKSR